MANVLTMTDDISVTFIIPKESRDENDCSEEMQLAFIACEQHRGGGLQARWVPEAEWTQFEGLTKRNVFVLSEFSGELYDKLRLTKCLLVGPRCLSCCLTEGTPIPSGPEPVFTVAMRGVVVTASGLSRQQKENIKKKVHWMGGIYSTVLTDETSHLVSDTVLSDKYIKSVQKGIPIMMESWIEDVWEMSLRLNVNGQSSDFNKHRLPPFTNLQVTTSGISKRDKQLIMKLVNENGGQFSGAFQSETTDIVVLNKDGIGSEKYKAALEYGKACVVPSWVIDSAAVRAALPLAKYRVAGASTSSPIANQSRLPDMSLNFSRITNVRAPNNFVDESRANDVTTMSGRIKMSQDSKKNDSSETDKEVEEEIEKLDMSQLKKIGPIFDGYCIWVVGSGAVAERVSGVVARLGGVRYSAPHARVSHALAASPRAAAAAARALPAVPVLRLRWLRDSLARGHVQNETEYLYDITPNTPSKSAQKPGIEPASPMSKRNLQLLRHSPLDLPPPDPRPPEPLEDDIVNHYLSQNIPAEREKTPELLPGRAPLEPDVTEDITEDPTEEIEQIFKGIIIEVQGLDEEAISELAAEVGAAGGVLAAAGAAASHVLVPLDYRPPAPTSAPLVTVFWLKDCLSQQELLPIQYYHRPVWVRSERALAGVVASLSTYSGVQRAFLDELAKLQGATTQLRFCRRTTATALASTHLICPTPTGDKYIGAVKWGLPAVRHTWLLECVEKGIRVSEKNHLVGETTVPSPTKQNGQDEATDGQQDEQKENAMQPPAGPEVPRRGSIPGAGDTPKHKLNEGEAMSPASRYIAMARQGLMDSQDTPRRLQDLISDAKLGTAQNVRTPPLDDALSTPNLAGLSPTTRRRLQAVKRGEMPSDPIKTPVDPFIRQQATPSSAFGCALRPGAGGEGGGRLSPDARKRLWDVVASLPSGQPPSDKEKTPLSEIRNRYLAQFNDSAQPTEHHIAARKLILQDQEDTPPSKMFKTSVNQSAGTSLSETRDKSLNNPSDTPRTSHNASSARGNASTVGGNASSAVSNASSAVSNASSAVSNASSGVNASSVLPGVDAQLQRLSAALSRGTPQRVKRSRDSVSLPVMESEPGPESQPNTVGWDDSPPRSEPPPPAPIKRFMLSSNVDNREEIISMILELGGEVTEGGEGDPAATHLLVAAPGRSEKMLCSVAAGRWALHPAYITRSREQQRFLDEEEFEWGNPVARGLGGLGALGAAERALAAAAHRWRAARGGPFAGLAALLHVPAARRTLLARLVAAGGGRALHDTPPYSNEEVTVCFADLKRYPLSERDKDWLRARRIPVCAPILLSSFLTDDPPPDPAQHCLPDFRYEHV